MKIKKPQLIFSLVLLLAMCCKNNDMVARGNNTELSKTVIKKYRVSENVILDISNKYGDVIFNIWDKDSIMIKAVATAYGKTSETRDKTLARTDFIFNQQNDYVTAKTVFDQSKGTLRDFWLSISDYSRALLSKEQIKVKYTVYAPAFTSVQVINKFGDVFVDAFKGNVIIDVSNGNLKIDSIPGKATIKARFCQGYIGTLSTATLDLKTSEIDLVSADRLDINSNTSKITLNHVHFLNLNSRADKININRLDTLFGNGSFSKINLYHLITSTSMEMNYGSLEIGTINPGFEKITVLGKSTDVRLTLSKKSYVKTTLQAKTGKLRLPLGNTLKQVYTDGKENFIHASGYLGNKSGPHAEIVIDAQGGNLQIDITP